MSVFRIKKVMRGIDKIVAGKVPPEMTYIAGGAVHFSFVSDDWQFRYLCSMDDARMILSAMKNGSPVERFAFDCESGMISFYSWCEADLCYNQTIIMLSEEQRDSFVAMVEGLFQD